MLFDTTSLFHKNIFDIYIITKWNSFSYSRFLTFLLRILLHNSSCTVWMHVWNEFDSKYYSMHNVRAFYCFIFSLERKTLCPWFSLIMCIKKLWLNLHFTITWTSFTSETILLKWRNIYNMVMLFHFIHPPVWSLTM